MKAAYIEQVGGPEQIVYGDLPAPEPGESQVLVRVKAVSVNPVDTYLRGGAAFWPLPQPFIVGCDLAGEVVAVGPGAKHFQVGDRVWGTNQGLVGRQGTFAEYCAVDECWLYRTPDQVSDQAAAACALVGVTAHLGLFRNQTLESGETLFVNGGTGGVGSMVVQMARLAGARVITTGGSAEKVARCLELGAEVAVNYKTEDVRAAVADFAPSGLNVFWETLLEPDFDAMLEMLADRGRIILMAGREARPPFPVGPFYLKECSVHGVVMFKAPPAEMRVCAEDINRWLASGELQPQIATVLPLSQAAEAHRLQEENTLQQRGTLAGKIVLCPDEG